MVDGAASAAACVMYVSFRFAAKVTAEAGIVTSVLKSYLLSVRVASLTALLMPPREELSCEAAASAAESAAFCNSALAV